VTPPSFRPRRERRDVEQAQARHQHADVAAGDRDRVRHLDLARDVGAVLRDFVALGRTVAFLEPVIHLGDSFELERVEPAHRLDRVLLLGFEVVRESGAREQIAHGFQGVSEPHPVDLLQSGDPFLSNAQSGEQFRVGVEDFLSALPEPQVERLSAKVRAEFVVLEFAFFPARGDRRDRAAQAERVDRRDERGDRLLGSEEGDARHRSRE
jgi:hypothetical protein